MVDAPDRSDTNVLGERILAQILDNIIVSFTGFLVFIVIALMGGVLSSFQEGVGAAFMGLSMLVFGVIFLGYSMILEYAWNGQTLGKRAVGIQVIKEDGKQIGGSEAFVRNIPIFALIIPYIGLLLYPTALIIIAVSEKRQRLFDMAAGTFVVKE